MVEMSIVLVILGIILTTVIKGGEVLKSSRIKGMVLTQNDLQQAVLMYREKFSYLPGDDPKADIHVGATTYIDALGVPQGNSASTATIKTANGNGNGVIEATESNWVFHHLMKAELITGTFNGSKPMVSNFNTNISIKDVNFSTFADGGTTAVVYELLPFDIAQALEYALDGYDPLVSPPNGSESYRTGSVRAPKDYKSANSPISFTYCALYPVAP